VECRAVSKFRPSNIVDNSKRQLCLYQSKVTPNRTKQNLVVRVGRSEAEVTNDKGLIMRSRYCTVEANYREIQTRSLSATTELLVIS